MLCEPGLTPILHNKVLWVLLSRPQVDLASTINSQRLTFQDHTAPEPRPSGFFQSASVYDRLRPERNCDDLKDNLKQSTLDKINSRKNRTIFHLERRDPDGREPIAGARFLSRCDLDIFCLRGSDGLLRAQEHCRST